MKLTVINIIIRLLLEVLKKVTDIVFDQERMPKDSQDLHDRTAKLHVVFNNGDETIRDDGNMNLYAYRVFGFTPKKS